MTFSRRPIEPLDPPPDRFQHVLKDAEGRRHRRATSVLGITAVFLAGVGGGASLDDGVRSVPASLVTLAGNLTADTPLDPSSAASTTAASRTPATAAARTAAKPVPSGKQAAPTVNAARPANPKVADAAAARPARPARALAPIGTLAVRGRALDSSGAPLAGLYVYAGEPDVDGFVPLATAAGVTDDRGRFSLPCPNSPVLLTPWPLNAPADALAGRAGWAARFLDGSTDPQLASDAACHRDRNRSVVRLQPGSVVEGTAVVASACEQDGDLQVQLFGDPRATVRLTGVWTGSGYRIAGLPPGEHALSFAGETESFAVTSGATVRQDLEGTCDATPQPTPAPTASPTPSATPTPTASPTSTPTSPTPTPDPKPSAATTTTSDPPPPLP